MKYLIISFTSRNQLFQFSKFLQTKNIQLQIINTPRSISRSCGLSGKIDYMYFNAIIYYLKLSNTRGLNGIFLFEQSGLREKIERLY